jgi:PAS domain S-box-containing protein
MTDGETSRVRADAAAQWEALAPSLQHAPVGFAVLDASLRYVFVNDKLAAINGIAAAAHVGRHLHEVVPDLADDAQAAFETVLSRGAADTFEFAGETQAMTGYWAEAAFPIEVPSGERYVGVIVADITDRKALERRLASEARTAARVVSELQRTLLPPAQLSTVDGVDLAGAYTPTAGAPIGGDWYGSAVARPDLISLSVGDVAGHGLGAVRAMAEIRFGLRSLALRGERPSVVLAALNAQATLLDEPFVTALIVDVDSQRLTATIASAGHPPPLVRHANGDVAIVSTLVAPPLGAIRDAVYPECIMTLAHGDTLLLYTDGLIERRGENLDTSIERLVQVFRSADRDDLSAACDTLMAHRADQGDDCAILLARIA